MLDAVEDPGGFPVESGDLLDLKPDDDGSGEYVYGFVVSPSGLKLVSAKGAGIAVVARARDLEGNLTIETIPVSVLTKPAPLTKPGLQTAERYTFGLAENVPNPFNPSTTIRYTLPEASDVRLVVYNILGQQVRVLIDGPKAEGVNQVVWDGRDAIGRSVATGVYLYRLTAGPDVAVRKMVFAK